MRVHGSTEDLAGGGLEKKICRTWWKGLQSRQKTDVPDLGTKAPLGPFSQTSPNRASYLFSLKGQAELPWCSFLFASKLELVK